MGDVDMHERVSATKQRVSEESVRRLPTRLASALKRLDAAAHITLGMAVALEPREAPFLGDAEVHQRVSESVRRRALAKT